MTINDYKNKIRQQLSYVDKVYWVLFAVLIIVAILALFSASSTLAFEKDSSTLGPIMEQMLFIVAGVGLAFILQFFPSKLIRIVSYAGLGISIVFLLLTFTSMGVEVNGAKRWLRIFGIVFQPSELAKLTLLLVVGDLLSRIKTAQDQKKYFFIVLALTVLVCSLILVGNLSTALLLGGIVFLLFFLARVHIKYWGTTLLIAVVMLVAGYFFIEKVYIEPNRKVEGVMKRATTWVGRIDDMIAEWKTPNEEFKLTDDNYQRTISKVAIARGGVSPVGVLPGNSQERDFLPQAFADYIFAIIVEESGIVGAVFLMLLYLAILFRSCLSSSKYADYAAMLMVMGLALMITCQALVSMMVAVGIGPVTGQPLPMISRGGTSVLITSLYFGIIMCVAREQNELHDRQQSATAASEEDVPEIYIE
ncbi:MAG: FtsW/RodA/SpoVE family cell cycle protein [Paludibacteraceae bacterium]|jgi:cell division protein FtsW|nr:FtsW/RodA/SpoVE family cell cycle protein [Paludibacteraceae bacterium]